MSRFFGAAKKKEPQPTLEDITGKLGGRQDSIQERIKKIDGELVRLRDRMKQMRPGPAQNSVKQQALRLLKQKKMFVLLVRRGCILMISRTGTKISLVHCKASRSMSELCGISFLTDFSSVGPSSFCRTTDEGHRPHCPLPKPHPELISVIDWAGFRDANSGKGTQTSVPWDASRED